MKKFLLFVFFLSCSVLAAAQEGFGFGFQAGWSLSHISGDTFDSKSGFIGGITATIPVFGNFYVQPEVNFQQQGGKYTRQFIVGDIVYNAVQLDMNYLNIPVLLKYRIAPTNLSIYIGPQVGFKLSAKEKLNDGNSFDFQNTKNTDFSGVYGLEYFFRLPEEKNVAFVVNARYITGFTTFARYAYSNMPEDNYRNNTLAVTLGFRF